MLSRIIATLLVVILHVQQASPQNVDSLMVLRDTTLISGEQIDLQLQIAYELSDSDIRAALDHANRALNDTSLIISELDAPAAVYGNTDEKSLQRTPVTE